MKLEPAVRREYEVRVREAVNLMERELDSPLTLEALAKVSAFSPYHFHRIYKEVTGETVHRSLMRLRVEKAAKQLLFHPDRKVTDIALECGLQSPSHFARAFKSVMGVPARAYRERYRLSTLRESFETDWELRQGAAAGEGLEAAYRRLPVEIQLLVACRHVYLRFTGPFLAQSEKSRIRALYLSVGRQLAAHGLVTPESQRIGVLLDDPYLTPGPQQRYDAGFTMMEAESSSLPRDLAERRLPGGRYAVVRMTSSDPYREPLLYLLHVRWLPASPYEWDASRPTFERIYDAIEPEGGYVFDFCLPVKLRS